MIKLVEMRNLRSGGILGRWRLVGKPKGKGRGRGRAGLIVNGCTLF